MTYIEELKLKEKKFNSIVCMGMDPILDKIPVKNDNVYTKIFSFYEDILNEIKKQSIYPSSVKPNYAYYAQYGIDGIKVLKDLITLYKKEDITVILDVKRGDIGTTAAAYAKEAYDFFEADAVTLAPYMGFDSIEPFTKNYPEKGAYILCKTSNKSSGDIQDIIVDGEPLFLKTAEKIIEWYSPGIGAVTGATYPEELDKITSKFKNAKKDIPLLIPGIGSQGGDLEKVLEVLLKNSDITIQRINSSSGINFAYLKENSNDYAGAAVRALKKLNNEINKIIKK